MSDCDYVAFLTQDAEPVDSSWLFDLVGVLAAVPGAALSFGRHEPYANADPFTKRDLDEHFSMLRNSPLIAGRDTDRERFQAADAGWLGFLRFNSDNNSCVAKEAWRRLPLPTINFGEDQAWAAEIVSAGYQKVYVDAASVFHSHSYGTEETRRRARTEAAFYRKLFGAAVSVGVTSERDLLHRLEELNARDVIFALENMIDEPILRRRLEINRARLEGHLLGHRDKRVVY